MAKHPGIVIISGLRRDDPEPIQQEDAEAALIDWCAEIRASGADVEYGGVLPNKQPETGGAP